MSKLSEDERKLVHGARRDFAKLKKKLRKLMRIQKDAGRGDAYQDAYAAFVAVSAAHVECGDRLKCCFPEDAGPVVLGGGGR